MKAKSSLGLLEKIATAVTTWSERWFPDSYIFAVLAIIVVGGGALMMGASFHSVALSFGDGFWSLIPFTMQMAIVSISGYVVAASPPAAKLIDWLAQRPRTGRGAIAYVAFVTIVASLLNWAFSLVFGGLLVKALARRTNLRLDYRAAGAAAYLGLGATWALGLSSSAAQLQANPASIPASLLPITGVIPFTETIFLPQSFILLGVITVLSLVVAYLSAPADDRVKTAQDLGIVLAEPVADPTRKSQRPGDWLDESPLASIVIAGLGFVWLINEFQTKEPLLAISNLNTYNFLFLMLGLLLNWRPRRFLHAVTLSVPSVAGVLIQFPLYGSLAFILTKATGPDGQALGHHIAQFFVSISSQNSFPGLMAVYSAVLGFFVPSGGGKWIIEAPYLMQASNDLHVHLGWTVQIYNAAEALPNLINPFFMLSLIGVLGLKARDIVGYTFTQFIFHVPVVIFLLWFLAGTLVYHAPVLP